MRMQEERHGPVVVLTPTGGIDLSTLPKFEGHVVKLLADGVRAVLWDLGDVEVLPSAAIGFLLQTSRRMSGAGGHMAIARVGRLARITLGTMGVLDVFAVHDTREAGIADLEGRLSA